MRISSLSRYVGFSVLLAATIAVTACTGGNRPEPFVPVPSTAPASGSVTSSTSATSALPSLSLSGIGVTGTLPTTSVAASIAVTLSVSAPNGITPFAKRRDAAPVASPTPLIYIELSSSTSTTLNAVPAFTFTLPSVVAGDSYYLAGYNGTQWFSPISGPATVSGTTVTFAAVATQIPISATQPVYIALFAVPTGSLTTPTPSPVSTPLASPGSLTLTAGGTPTTLGVSEPGDTAAFTASINCTLNPAVPSPLPTSNPFVAQVSSSATPAGAGASAAFTVTPGNETGACTITVTDANSASITVPVTVNNTGVTVYGKSRN